MAYDEKLWFQFLAQNKILFGRNRSATVGEEVDALGKKRALLICGTVLAKSELVERIKVALGQRCVGVFGDIPPHSSVEAVERGAELSREVGADILVGIGGGSTLDTTKIIAFLLSEGGRLRDLASRFEPPDRFYHRPVTRPPRIPTIALPTTGSASEVDGWGACVDRAKGIKLIFGDPQLTPKVAILDPELTTSLPPLITAGSGMNSFAHCVEALYSKNRQPICDGLALHAIRLIVEYLPRCVENGNDLLARGQQQIATAMSGIAMANANVCLHHGICHCLGARYNIHHGTANGIMLPYVMAYNLEVCTDRLALVAQAMGSDTRGLSDAEAATAAIEAVRQLTRRIGHPQRLREVGVPRDGLEQVARDVMYDPCILYNPKPILKAEQVLEVLQQAW